MRIRKRVRAARPSHELLTSLLGLTVKIVLLQGIGLGDSSRKVMMPYLEVLAGDAVEFTVT